MEQESSESCPDETSHSPLDDSAQRLLTWLEELRATGHVSRIAPPAETEPLAVGEIRRISASSGQNYWSALGSVGHIDWESGRAMVVLVKSSEFATVRDVLLTGPADAGFPWPAMAVVDAVASIHVSQLSDNPILGRIPREIAALLVRLHIFDKERAIRAIGDAGLSMGIMSCQSGDALWYERGDWANELPQLAWRL